MDGREMMDASHGSKTRCKSRGPGLPSSPSSGKRPPSCGRHEAWTPLHGSSLRCITCLLSVRVYSPAAPRATVTTVSCPPFKAKNWQLHLCGLETFL